MNSVLPDDDRSFFDTSMDHGIIDGVPSMYVCISHVWESLSAASGPSGCTDTWMYGGSALLLAL